MNKDIAINAVKFVATLADAHFLSLFLELRVKQPILGQLLVASAAVEEILESSSDGKVRLLNGMLLRAVGYIVLNDELYAVLSLIYQVFKLHVLFKKHIKSSVGLNFQLIVLTSSGQFRA